jgi:glycosyltransferase involved in cell wall biosynthesis
MSRKKKILIHTNSPSAKTGLGENGRYLMEYLLKNCSNKYELVYYCSMGHAADPGLSTIPCKAIGTIPNNPQVHQEMNKNEGYARFVSYGGLMIDEVIKQEKPDIYWMSDDQWAFNDFQNKNWFTKINCVEHITLDSLPILDSAFEHASKTPNYVTWANFAREEMQKIDPKKYAHAKTIHGLFDTTDFSPITKERKRELRNKFGIANDELIFFYMSRNQLRKGFPLIIQAFAQFKKKNPNIKAKLFFHTSFSEKGHGWDIEKLRDYYGLKKDDILATYVCKNCGKWEVKPYSGEDLDCKFCGAKKSQISANISIGVPDCDMKYIHGIADASINAFNSGGQERSIPASLLCSLPTAVTNYSCGTDYTDNNFVFPLDWNPYYEPGTNFIKAATSIKSIVGFMEQIYRMPESERIEIGRKGREWAVKTFSVETIGKQWEELFDSLPLIDWSQINLDAPKSNPNYQLPPNYKELPPNEFVTLLYKEILLRDPDEGGFKNWMTQLQNNVSREKVYEFFLGVARNETPAKQNSLWDLIDKDRPNKRILFALKQSAGDIAISTALFKSIKEQYFGYDLYYMCESRYHEILDGNPYIYKVLPWVDILDHEMFVIGAGSKEKLFDVYLNPSVATQTKLSYLSNNNPALTS